jgi:hypothetical protein
VLLEVMLIELISGFRLDKGKLDMIYIS